MRKLDFKDAVASVAETLRHAREAGSLACVLVGAGVSKAGNIPLAGELVQQIREKFPAATRDLSPKAANAYGAHMERLSSMQRRDVLTRHIANAQINWANLALAQLMATEFVGRVLTTNFDPLLSRAAALLGPLPAVYDFGAAPADNLSLIASPAVIHLHGQGYGVVLLNSEEETASHRAKLAPLIKDSLGRGPLLVVGYSGGADGVFDTIADAYSNEDNLYWISHGPTPQAKVAQFIESSRYATLIPNTDADQFLIALAQELEVWPPLLIEAPVEALLRSLNQVSDYPLAAHAADARHGPSLDRRTSNCDLLNLVRSTLARIADSERTEPRAIALRRIADHFHRGENDEAIVRAEEWLAQSPEDEHARFFGYAAAQKLGHKASAEAAGANGSAARAAYEVALEHFEHAIALSSSPVEALVSAGQTCAAMLPYLDAAEIPASLERVEGYFKRAVALEPDFHGAYCSWGRALITYLERTHDARLFQRTNEVMKEAYRTEKGCFSTAAHWGALMVMETNVEPDLAKRKELLDNARGRLTAVVEHYPDWLPARVSLAGALVGLARFGQDQDETRRLLEEAIAHSSHALTVAPQETKASLNLVAAATALTNIEQNEQTLRQLEHAVAGLRSVIEKNSAQSPFVDPIASIIYAAAASALANTEPTSEHLEWLRDAIARLRETIQAHPHLEIAHNNLSAGLTLLMFREPESVDAGLLQEAEEAIEAAKTFSQREPQGLNGLGGMMLEIGNRSDDAGIARTAHRIAARLLTDAEELQPGSASYNLACLMALAGESDICRELLVRCVSFDTLPERTDIEGDTDLASVRHEEWFREILEQAPRAVPEDNRPEGLANAAE